MKHLSYTLLTISIILLASISVVSAAPVFEPIDAPDPAIVGMIEQVNESLVFHYHDNLLDFAPRYTGTETCELAGQYLYEAFQDMGLEVEFHNWRFDRFVSRNIVATLPGNDPDSDAIFIMSAHYDTTPTSPGADDDGSGVAAVLATAKILSNYSFNHTIRFIAHSGEEVGAYGSFTYARDAYDNGDNIVAVINADMIGYANTVEGGKTMRVFVPERSQWIADFTKTVSNVYRNETDMSIEQIPNYIGADHQAFIDYGYDAVFLAHYDGYSWGHSENDTADRINWTYQVKATKFLLAVMAELASTPIDLQVVITAPSEGYGYFFNRPIIPLSLGRSWYRSLRGATVILGRAWATADVITDEEIEDVVFCIDGNFMEWYSEPPFEWRIQGKHAPPIGRHTLKVYAYTTSGKVATDEMEIFIFTLSCQYGRW